MHTAADCEPHSMFPSMKFVGRLRSLHVVNDDALNWLKTAPTTALTSYKVT